MVIVGSEAESYKKAAVLDAKGLGTHEDGGCIELYMLPLAYQRHRLQSCDME